MMTGPRTLPSRLAPVSKGSFRVHLSPYGRRPLLEPLLMSGDIAMFSKGLRKGGGQPS
jgi:hypothetical protein